MNVQKEISQLYNNINLKKTTKKMSTTTSNLNKKAHNTHNFSLPQNNLVKTTSSTNTPNLQLEKFERSQNKRKTLHQISNFQITSSKLLNDFSNTLTTESTKGLKKKYSLKLKHPKEVPYQSLKTELTKNEQNESFDAENVAERQDTVVKVETIKIQETKENKNIDMTKIKHSSKSLTNTNSQALDNGKIIIL